MIDFIRYVSAVVAIESIFLSCRRFDMPCTIGFLFHIGIIESVDVNRQTETVL